MWVKDKIYGFVVCSTVESEAKLIILEYLHHNYICVCEWVKDSTPFILATTGLEEREY